MIINNEEETIMIDPVTSKVNQKIKQKLSSQLTPNVGIDKVGPSKFDHAMEAVKSTQSNDMADAIAKVGVDNPNNDIQTISAHDINVNLDQPEVSKIDPADNSGVGNKAYDMLTEMNWDFNKMETMVEKIANSDSYNMKDLMKMQLAVGKIGVSLDLAAKIPQQLTQGVSTILQSQV